MLNRKERLKQRKLEALLRKRELDNKTSLIQCPSSILTPSSEVVERFREASKGKYVRWRNVNGRVNID